MSPPKRYFAARRWALIAALLGSYLTYQGLTTVTEPGWSRALGIALLIVAPWQLLQAWMYLRRPVLEFHDDRVEIHHPLSKGKLPELRFEHLGRLRWSTRTNLCFEHARRGSAVVGTMLLTKRDRDEVLVALEAAAGI